MAVSVKTTSMQCYIVYPIFFYQFGNSPCMMKSFLLEKLLVRKLTNTLLKCLNSLARLAFIKPLRASTIFYSLLRGNLPLLIYSKFNPYISVPPASLLCPPPHKKAMNNINKKKVEAKKFELTFSIT